MQAASSRCSRNTSNATGIKRPHRRRHVAAADIRRADPIAEAAGLRDAAADVGKREPADQGVVLAAEQEERIGLIGPHVLGIAPQPLAEAPAA